MRNETYCYAKRKCLNSRDRYVLDSFEINTYLTDGSNDTHKSKNTSACSIISAFRFKHGCATSATVPKSSGTSLHFLLGFIVLGCVFFPGGGIGIPMSEACGFIALDNARFTQDLPARPLRQSTGGCEGMLKMFWRSVQRLIQNTGGCEGMMETPWWSLQRCERLLL